MSIKKIIGATALMGMMATASASSVSLVYTGDNMIDADGAILSEVADTLTFDLIIDFSDVVPVPGGLGGTIGGGFDVNFDTAGVEFGEYNSAGLGDPFFGRDPVVEDGRLFNGAIGDFGGLMTGTIASISFTVIGTAGDYLIAPSGTDGDSGVFISGNDFISPLAVDYFGQTVRVVPVPAAVWFMLSGLGALIGFGRRKAA